MSMSDETKPRRAPMIPVPGPGPGLTQKPEPISKQAMALRDERRLDDAARQRTVPPLMRSDDGGRSWGLAPTGVGQIAKAISGVMQSVGTIKKRGRNEHFKYDYALMEDVLEALTPLIGKHGLTIFQNEKEIKMEGSRLAVTYEFSVIHESGEFWPEKIRQTGASIARDSKGNFDDKAIAKCHTQARKYFLLSLFQVPAGDFEDADSDNGQQKPVPGPSSALKAAEKKPDDDKIPMEDKTKPHQIKGTGPEVKPWANAYLKAIGQAKSVEEIELWDQLNDGALQKISENYPDLYATLTAAVARRTVDVRPPEPEGLPADTQEAMNWVANQLSLASDFEFAQKFWNEYVAPHEGRFDTLDWELLMREWQRAEDRLKPPDTPEAA